MLGDAYEEVVAHEVAHGFCKHLWKQSGWHAEMFKWVMRVVLGYKKHQTRHSYDVASAKEIGDMLTLACKAGKFDDYEEISLRPPRGKSGISHNEVRLDDAHRTETKWTVVTRHDGGWEPGNGTHELIVVRLKYDDCKVYIHGGPFGCSRNYIFDNDEDAMRTFLSEHGCKLVSMS
jgi:hypothetical protein